MTGTYWWDINSTSGTSNTATFDVSSINDTVTVYSPGVDRDDRSENERWLDQRVDDMLGNL